jgi:chaperonin GroEL
VTATKEHTTIVGGRDCKELIQNRIEEIKALLNQVTDYEKEKMNERIAKLYGGVAIIKVGGKTKAEMKELKDRIQDAVGSTKSAMEKGVVAGGGVALLKASKILDNVELETIEDKIAADIIKKACRQPARQIAKNAWFNGDHIVKTIERGPDNFGFNALTSQFGDMIEMGIVDPLKTVCHALEIATSEVGIFLTSEYIISND